MLNTNITRLIINIQSSFYLVCGWCQRRWYYPNKPVILSVQDIGLFSIKRGLAYKIRTLLAVPHNHGELFIGGYQNKAYLQKMDMTSKKAENLLIPALTEDAVAYFAQNPSDEDQMSFATFKNDVYISNDQGLKWKKIADQGKSISEGNEEGK